MFPLLVPGLMLGGSLLSGIFGNKGQSQTSTPTLPPTMQPLQTQLQSLIMQRMRNGSLPSGYEAGQIQGINNTYRRIGQSQANSLTARGLGTSPVAGAVDASRELARGGDIVRMQQSLPFVQREMQNQDYGLAQALLNANRGTTTTGSGNMAGGGLESLTSMLAYLFGKGALGNVGSFQVGD